MNWTNLFWIGIEALNISDLTSYHTISSGYFAVFSNLTSGNYQITLFLNEICKYTFTASVSQIEDTQLGLQVNVKNPTCGNSNGSVITSNPNIYSNLNYLWSDGTSNSNLTQVGPGIYCLTVTDSYCGYFNKCYELIDSEINVNLLTLENISICESGEGITPCNGEIFISHKSVIPGAISWSGPNGFTSSSSSLTGLCYPGTYTVTITEAGCPQLIRSYKVCCCEEIVLQEPNPGLCENGGNDIPLNVSGEVFHCFNNNNEGVISITISGGQGATPSFSWGGPNGPFQGNKVISNLEPGQYCVTVKDGCSTVTECYIVENYNCNENYTNQELIDLFIQEEEEPCTGGLNGEITINIPYNPGIKPLVYIDRNFPLELELVHLGYIAHANNLPANQTISITIELGECVFTFNYFTGEGQLIRRFDRLEGLVCHYRQYCGTNYLGEIFEPAFVDMPNGSSTVFGSCSAPVYCNGEEVDRMHFALIRVSITEYVHIIASFLLQELISPEYFNVLMADVSNRELRECDKVDYCPGDLTIVGEHEVYEFFPYYDAEIATDENGCVHVNCPFPLSDIEFCPDDLNIGDLLDDLFNEDNFCTPTEHSFVQLLAWEEVDFFPQAYYSSTLKDFVDENKDDPRSSCTKVRFCCNSFQFLSSNILEIYCYDQIGCLPICNNPPVNCSRNWCTVDEVTALVAICSYSSNANCPGTLVGELDNVNICGSYGPQFINPDNENNIEVATLLDKFIFSQRHGTEIIAYPSVFTSEISVSISDANIKGVNLVDQQGRIIHNFKVVDLGVSRLTIDNIPKGMYFLHFFNFAGESIAYKTVIHE